jgi:hypothetical protein
MLVNNKGQGQVDVLIYSQKMIRNFLGLKLHFKSLVGREKVHKRVLLH